MSTFLDDIFTHAATRPDASAIVTPDTVVRYTDFAARTDRLARALVARGVGPEQVCAVMVDRGPEAVIAMAAVLRAGGAFLTLNVELPDQRLAAMVRTAQARFLVTTPTRAGQLDLPIDGPTVFVDAPDVPATLRPLSPRSLAYVSHTSGSSGPPNAVLLEHRGVTNYLRFIVDDYELDPDTVVLQFAPFGYDASIRDTFAPLVAGGQVVLVPRSTLLRNGEFAAAVREWGVNTILSATPTFLTSLRQSDLPDLRLTVSSGESLRPFLVAGGRDCVRGRMVNQYGPTETTMTATRFDVPAVPDATVDLIGKPIDGVSVRLLDDNLHTVPDGGVGEVWIGGCGVARGYSGRPALTAARFVPDPHGTPGTRMYRTGDLARRLPDGDLVYLGRIDRQIKVRGYRIDPAEIEGALLAHPAVAGAVVTAGTDVDGRVFLIAHVAGAPAEVTDSALRAHLAMTLPHYMIPRRFVRIDSVPTTVSGKTDRRAITVDGP
ncbi:amino acid adenylation domain-containing protein [Micromonospora sp. ATCC 39149]|uniref:Amino acid adenylation domain-containing protein n=1 Tax=Micromonospora carbonacea TaxID=47853 RepID=A0A7D6GNM6_9ACTN|nr:amino acid adenylation domain-containing protein [Micromonospora sp. ATCC 39149]QLK00649.1 amino acid adenylation domain-containing protein [Micromonospora carbonacea]